jgi:excisionase family DNA binding protein
MSINFEKMAKDIEETKTLLSMLVEQKQPSKGESKYLNIQECADFLGLAKPSVYAKVSKGTIPFHKAKGGKRVYFLQSELESWLSGDLLLDVKK